MTATFASSANSAELTTYATLSDTRPGNITITPGGRVIITQQPLEAPSLRVVEILPVGSKKPFPTQDWADGPPRLERWVSPDGFAPDGTLFVTQNQLHDHLALHKGVDGSDKRYHILPMKS